MWFVYLCSIVAVTRQSSEMICVWFKRGFDASLHTRAGQPRHLGQTCVLGGHRVALIVLDGRFVLGRVANSHGYEH